MKAVLNKLRQKLGFAFLTLAGSAFFVTNAWGASAMPQFDTKTFPEQIFWLIVSFTILFFIMWKIALPIVHDTLVKREKKIEEDLKKAEALRDEALELQEKAETMLASARAEAHQVFVKVHEDLSLQEHQRVQELQENLNKRMKESEKKILTAQKAYLSHAKEIAVTLSESILSKIALVEDDKKQLESYIEALSKEHKDRG